MKKEYIILFVVLLALVVMFGYYKINQLQTELVGHQQNINFDLSSKCSNDAKNLFYKNWAVNPSKQDILLDYQNHYNKKLNKCYMLISYNFYLSEQTGLISKSLIFYDVEDNAKLGETGEESGGMYSIPVLDVCQILGKKCASVSDFMNVVRPYMND